MLIVSKFGGTSMASARSIRQVAQILETHPHRKVAVVSAPGKLGNRKKVTDLLIEKSLHEVIMRFRAIIADLGLSSKVVQHLYGKLATLHAEENADSLVSFGEYMSAYVLASFLRWKFIDARDTLFFGCDSVSIVQTWDTSERVVIPGFYGYDVDKERIRVFSRGGSDISGSYIAAHCGADLYENWTDVSGVYDSDPRHCRSARRHEYLRYHELERVALNGAQVFHPSAVSPAFEARIPIMIKNTFAPHEAGTLVF